MKVSTIDPIADATWAALVEDRPSDVFSSPAWLQVIRDTYDFDMRAAVVYPDSSSPPRAGVPFAAIRDLRGDRNVAVPYSDYCDGVVGSADDWQALSTELLGHGSLVSLRCLENEFPVGDSRFAPAGTAAHHALDLTPGTDQVWAGLAGSARRAARRATNAELRAESVAEAKLLREFFLLHLRNRKYKYRILAQPYRFFEAIWHRFIETGNGALLGAFHRDELIAGVVLLKWQNTAYYKYNASSPQHLNLRPNDLLMWASIEWAIDAGCSTFDLGLSDLEQPGLLRYKRKWASDERVIRLYESSSPENATSAQQQTRPFLDGLSDLFSRDDVPDEITERAGDLLYRFFA